MNGNDLNNNLNKLLRHLDSIKETLPMVLLLLRPSHGKRVQKFQKFVKENVEEIEKGDGVETVSMAYEHLHVFNQLSKNIGTSSLAFKIIPESLFVSLISQYDSFLNQLLRILFNIRPEYINNSERELTFSNLNEFESIEKAREYIIEKEVESVLRKNHNEHFTYLESKLGTPLKKDLPIWKTFIEITERRNLFVHCDGVVSSQYIKVCSENKCLPKDVKLNQRLRIDIDYFNLAHECLYEITTKLTHTIWRKLIKTDIKKADEKLNEMCYELITNAQYQLADIVLDFACKQTKHYNDSSKNLFIVNKALSQFLQGNKENAKEIIESKDWSASSDSFKMAHLILMERRDDVYSLIKKIGIDGDLHKEDYKTWPLFYGLREEEDFKNLYKEIFKEDYKVIEIPKRPVQELIEELNSKSPKTKPKETVKKVPKSKIERKKPVRQTNGEKQNSASKQKK